MADSCVNKNLHTELHMEEIDVTDWDKAILCAEGQIEGARKRIRELRRAIRSFRELKESGIKREKVGASPAPANP
jgi:hypothetical protein